MVMEFFVDAAFTFTGAAGGFGIVDTVFAAQYELEPSALFERI